MEVIDLAKLARELPDELVRTRELIVATLDVNSARSDLRVAADLASQAVALIENPPQMEPQTLEDCTLALTSSAIVFYAKATKANSKHRRSYDIRSYFDEDEKAAHRLICKLRDDAVAHYGPGEISPEHKLRSDYLVVPVEGGALLAISRHTYGNRELGRKIAEQARIAALIMQRLYEEKEALLGPALNEAFSRRDLDEATEAARVSLGDAIGDHEVARQLLEGPRVGTKRLFTTTRGP